MAITYGQPTRFSCPACATEVQAEACLVLDVAERPDLTARALDGTLHDVQCPNCKAAIRFEAPLLIYQSATEPHLLFSPAANEANVQSDVRARNDPEWLLDVLRRALGERWRNELIASGIPVVSRPMLRHALQPASPRPPVSANVSGPVILGVPDGVSEEDVFALLNPLGSASDADIDRAATAWRRASQVSLDGIPAALRIQILNQGAQAAWLRYKARHDTADLDLALTGWQRVVEQTPEKTRLRAERLNNLTVGFTAKYDATDERAAAREAALAAREAAALVVGDLQEHPRYERNLAAAEGNLGRALLKQYAIDRNEAVLEEAVTSLVQAFKLRPVAELALDAVNALAQRFEAKGNLADLDDAIRTVNDAIALVATDDDMGRATLLLGNLLCSRHESRRNPTDLDDAISAFQKALESFGESDPNWALCRNNYSSARRDRYVRSGDATDLDEALRASEDALRHTQDSSRRAMYLSNLAAHLLTRDERSASEADLTRAIKLIEEALALASVGTPESVATAVNLARALERVYERYGRASDLEQATESYRTACLRARSHQLGMTMDASRSWTMSALRRMRWREAMEASSFGVEAFEQLYASNVLRRDREAWQRAVRGIAMMRAYALARDGQLVAAATGLEQAWARQLTESMGPGPADLRELETTNPSLLEEYRTATARLRRFELEDRHPRSTRNESEQSAALPARRAMLKQVRAEWEAVVDRLRAVTPSEQSAQTGDITAIAASLAAGQAIVYLFATPVGSLALIVSRKEPGGAQAPQIPIACLDAVWIDEFTLDDLQLLLVKRDKGQVVGGYLPGRSHDFEWLQPALQEALPKLGKCLLAPVAARLRELAISEVAFVAGGFLAALPLAAATYSVDGRSLCFLDEFTVSSVPSARLLFHARQTLDSERMRVASLLAVGNPLPLPEGFKTLVGAEEEAKAISTWFDDRAIVLCGVDATLANVKVQLPGKTHLHFACHGLFASAHPLFSSLVLADGEALTMGSVLYELDVRGTRLAVLSACEAAAIDLDSLPEEAVGFPAGFLQAGASGVVAPLWKVGDKATQYLMTAFYELMFKGDTTEGVGPMPPALALRRAQQRLRKMTSDPRHWAAFAFYGAW